MITASSRIIVVVAVVLLVTSLAVIVYNRKPDQPRPTAFESEAPPPAYDFHRLEAADQDALMLLKDRVEARTLERASASGLPQQAAFARHAAELLGAYASGSIENVSDALRQVGLNETADGYLVNGTSRHVAEAGMMTMEGLQLDTSSVRIRHREVENQELVVALSPFRSAISLGYNSRLKSIEIGDSAAGTTQAYEVLIDAKMQSSTRLVGTPQSFHGTLGITYVYDLRTKAWVPISSSVYNAPLDFRVSSPPV